MTFDEYKEGGRERYTSMVGAIRHILAAALKANSMEAHAITGRAKQPDSLEKKLADRGIDHAAAVDEEIKDLAGCRVVFLTNEQVECFNGTGAIHDNFDVIDVNVHHPVPGTVTETKLFDSTNYFVQLKPDRLNLPEYKPFEGMRAEIQIQTLLNHAWAEMGHDTIYKEPAFRHIDPAHLKMIERRMNTVMREHLLPAGHDFDKIARDFDRIVRADKGFDDAVATINGSANNDELVAAMETLDTLVLPLLADRGDTFVKLTPALIAAVERARGSAAAEVETIVGSFPGRNGQVVARSFAKLLEHHRFFNRALTFDTLVQMSAGAEGDGERKIWNDLGALFASHDLEAWQARGPIVQKEILAGITKLEPERIAASRDLIVAMLAKVLTTEVRGVSRGELHTVHIHSGSVVASVELRKVRTEAIDMLDRLLDEATDDAARGRILAALRIATTPPHNGGDEAIRALVMDDAARVAAIERARAPGWGLELRRQSEIGALRVYRNFHALPKEMAGNGELVAAQRNVIGELMALRDALNADAELVLYKTLIGKDSVRPDAWEGRAFDHRANEQWRSERHAVIAMEAEPSQSGEWIERIRRYLAQVANVWDRSPMGDFVEVLAATRPDVVEPLLDEIDDALTSVLVKLMLGLEKAGRTETINRHVASWLAKGQHLTHLADWSRRMDRVDPDLLAAVAARASEIGDDAAVIETLDSAGRLYQREADTRLIDVVFMPGIEHLTGSKNPNWVDNSWGATEGALLSALDEAQCRQVLASFVTISAIDYSGDRVLAVVADRFPELVSAFFGERIVMDRGDGTRFEPIPFDIHDLKLALERHPRLLLETARGWYRHDPLYHEYRGGRLVGNVFPELSGEIADTLREIVQGGECGDLEFILTTLLAYEGADFIHPLCMEVVERLEEGDDLLGRVSQVLRHSGVLTGDFGMVRADTQQHSRIKGWLDDPREKVKAFGRSELRRIERSMAWEQRRAQRDVEQMKRDWSSGEDKPGAAAD